jgi:hypothetical protein
MNNKPASTSSELSETAPISRFSTSTVSNSHYLVPWLAAEGPLAYTPTEPPASDYFFQYSWILPGIFNPTVNRRRHYYFGSDDKGAARFLFEFWSQARQGRGADLQIYHDSGRFSDTEVTAPIAAYHHVRRWYDTAGAVLMQHGSYQWIALEDQPLIEQGEVLLFRGIGESSEFRRLRFHPEDLSQRNREIWRRYVGAHVTMLSDSVLSFNTIHDRVVRTETGSLRHASGLSDDIAASAGLDIHSPGFAQDLWRASQEGYSLDPVIALRKFGPHHVVLRTPLDNIRITTSLRTNLRPRSSIQLGFR